MKAERPAGLVSSLTHVNIAVLIAKLIARVDTRVLVSEHNQISRKARVAKGPRGWLTYRAVPLLYRRADVIVAVSQGVADDLADFAGLPQGRVECIYNPVYDETLVAAAAQPVDHPWMAPGQPPVIVAAGRLQEQKGFDVLLRAFQAVRRVRDVRLIIMGEGEDRAKLERLVAELGLGDSVSLIGFVENPYAMMARAQVFVLSSRWEGFSLVLVEAMACGAPIVSTDCPSGPREVLADGRYGKLVPIEDPVSLSEAIVQVLDDPGPSARDRAQSFTVRDAADAYLKALERS
jgi:glycosyltransferase involved in cell wall biosynthesis